MRSARLARSTRCCGIGLKRESPMTQAYTDDRKHLVTEGYQIFCCGCGSRRIGCAPRILIKRQSTRDSLEIGRIDSRSLGDRLAILWNRLGPNLARHIASEGWW